MVSESYELLDFGGGKRLERWGQFTLVRPDPTSVDVSPKHLTLWHSPDAVYAGEKGKGEWKKRVAIPEQWPVPFDDLRLAVRLAPYKHTGVFPEQQQNWQWLRKEAAKLSTGQLTVLNLFAYTGGSTMALAKNGHFVTHVDASRPAITWAKENSVLNSIAGDRIRWMLEDAPAFATKELKRGKRYDGIILDPPAFGHSPTGKTWRVERDLAPLLEICAQLLSEKPAFLLLNGYAQNDTPESFRRLLLAIFQQKTKLRNVEIFTGDLALSTADGRSLSTGTVARCSFR